MAIATADLKTSESDGIEERILETVYGCVNRALPLDSNEKFLQPICGSFGLDEDALSGV